MAGVNTADSRLTNILDERNQMRNEVQSAYDQSVGLADSKYNELIQAAKDYGQKQADIQQQQTDQAITEIEQNKEKTTRDYTKEQKGAYADYANQTNDYGVNAEKMAAAGLTGGGYEESSRVRIYTAYQNRVATARQTYGDAITNYDNQIANARIQNSARLAEIAYNALQTQLQLSIENLQYKNELLQALTNQKLSINSSYNQLWQSMYNTLLQESQFNEEMAFNKEWKEKEFAYQKERDKVKDSQWAKEYQLSLAQLNKSRSSSKKSSSSSKGQTPSDISNTSSSSNVQGPPLIEVVNENTIRIIEANGKSHTITTANKSRDDIINEGNKYNVNLSSYLE